MEPRLSMQGISTFYQERIKVVDNSSNILLFSFNPKMLEKLTEEQKEALGKGVQTILDRYEEIATNASLESNMFEVSPKEESTLLQGKPNFN